MYLGFERIEFDMHQNINLKKANKWVNSHTLKGDTKSTNTK